MGPHRRAVVAGASPKAALVDKARTLGVPVLDVDGLRALLDGASLADVVAGRAKGAGERGASREAPPATLAGKRVSVIGLVGATKASLGSALERLGAKLVERPSKKIDLLVLGEGPGFDAIEAMDDGVPFVRRAALDALLAGSPLTDFVAAPVAAVSDPAARAREILESVRPELLALVSGERWEDELTLTLRPDGRAVAKLRDMSGTPLHDHVREVIQKQSWPSVSGDVTVTVPIVFV